MTTRIYSITKAPLGWSIYCDDAKVGGVFASKSAAFEVANVAASIAIQKGEGVQVNVPAALGTAEVTEHPADERNWAASLEGL